MAGLSLGGSFGEVAKLIASLELKDQFTGPISKADKALGSTERRFSTLEKVSYTAGRGLRNTADNLGRLAVAGAGLVASQVALGVRSLAALETVNNQTAAVIKSTEGAAGVSTEHIRAQAEALENLSTVDDKAIQAGENMLLTFTNIRNEVGAGNDIFDQATTTLLNLSVAMGTEPKAAAIQLGKALNDPIKGITALTRVGVTFTDEQKDQITALVEAGKRMEAQKIILHELNREFGGSAEAFGKGPAATMRRFGDAVEGAQQALATGFLPLMEKVSARVQEALGDPKVLANIKAFGESAAAGIDQLISIGAKLPWDAIGASAKLMGQGAKALLDAFTSMPAWVQTAVLTGWGLNKLTGGALGSIAGTLAKSLFGQIRGATPATPVFTREVGIPGTGGAPTVGGGGGGILGTLGKVAGLAIGAAAAAEIGNLIGHSVFFDPTVKPAVEFEGSQFERFVQANEGNAAALERGLQAVQGGLDDLPPLAHILAADQTAELERQRDVLQQLLTEAKAQARDAGDASHVPSWVHDQTSATEDNTAALKNLTLEQRLQRDKGFKEGITTPGQFLRLLARTSEFGKRGVGTSIEQGPTTGRDPFGKAFIALVRRLDDHTLANNRVQGEIRRHISAAQELLRIANREGDRKAQQKLQGTIDTLRRLLGVERDGHRATARHIDLTSGRAQNVLRGIKADSASTAHSSLVTSQKDFSPQVNVGVTSYTTVSVSDIIRQSFVARVAQNVPTGFVP